MSVQTVSGVKATEPNEHGYRSFSLGEFTFRRDEYFVYVKWPTGRHVLSADGFLRALQRDVAWEFFYGTVNFDGVVGTVNHYGTVDLFAGRYNDAYRKAELDHVENFPTPVIKATFNAMLDDWTNSTFDPFASPHETGTAFGPRPATTGRPSRGGGSPQSRWWPCRGTRRFGPPRPAIRSTATSSTCRRMSPRSSSSRASRDR